MNIFTLPNFISLLRIPFALLFLQDSVVLRCLALLLAMLSDGLDGFIARRYKLSSTVGTLLDPLMDRIFVFFVLFIFIQEGSISLGQTATMLCRDVSIFIFGLYLAWNKRLITYKFHAIWCGKITTCLQLITLLAITFQIALPNSFFGLFIFFGLLALVELYSTGEPQITPLRKLTTD